MRISLDDFGTGYSSLSYLHNFPLQKVKIDRSFLEGIDSDRPLTLLRGVARLSADLGMSVVVEGIETNEQLELISADGTRDRGAGLSVQPAGPGGAGPPAAERLAWPPSAGGAAGPAFLAVHRLIPVKIRRLALNPKIVIPLHGR